MRISDADRRAQIAALKHQIMALEAPDREKAKIARAKMKRQRDGALARDFCQRTPRIKDPAYLRFIRRQPCCVCGKPAPSQAAHIRSGYPEAGWRPTGMQEKPDDFRTLPLCSTCHLDGPKAQHKANESQWWRGHDIHPPSLCARFLSQYQGNADAA